MSLWNTTALPGIYERFVDGDGSKYHVEKVQDVQPILERNKALRNKDDGFNAARDGRRIASIPMVVIMQWRNEGFDAFDPNNADELKRRLNSSDWRYLRTSEGAL